MKNVIFAVINHFVTWWSKLSDEMAFTIWFLIWYIPLLNACLSNNYRDWIISLVVAAACGVWFIADDLVSRYKKQLENSRNNMREATRIAMEEMDHHCNSERRKKN